MVSDMAYYHALEDIALLEHQRDQLHEALGKIVECWDGPLYQREMLPLIQKARAVLKAMERND